MDNNKRRTKQIKSINGSLVKRVILLFLVAYTSKRGGQNKNILYKNDG